MPQGKSNSEGQKSSNTSSSSSSNSTGERSNNSYYKPFGGWPRWMHSHGLNPWNSDDVEEGKAILEGYKALDREKDSGK